MAEYTDNKKENIIGKANTNLYSNNDISCNGIINVGKLKKWLQDNEETMFKDNTGNQHCFIKVQKLKKPFEKHTHMVILSTASDSKKPNTSFDNQTPNNAKDDLPF